MSLSQYLLVANSKPTTVDDTVWTKFYSEEHIPDVVGCGVATRAMVYTENFDHPLAPPPNDRNELNFKVIYESEHKHPLSHPGARKIRNDSDILPGRKPGQESAKVDVGAFEKIQEFDPFNKGFTPAPVILWVEFEIKQEDAEDFDKWYREEHLPMLSKVPGYRRAQRYRANRPVEGKPKDGPIKFLAWHDVESTAGISSKEFAASIQTEWTKSIQQKAVSSNLRVFNLETSVGYSNVRASKV